MPENQGDLWTFLWTYTKRAYRGVCKPLNLMAGSTGLEPAASAVTGQQKHVTD